MCIANIKIKKIILSIQTAHVVCAVIFVYNYVYYMVNHVVYMRDMYISIRKVRYMRIYIYENVEAHEWPGDGGNVHPFVYIHHNIHNSSIILLY